jgi:hypothetical protein
MEQVWILILLCTSLTHCDDTNNNYRKATPYVTEVECEEAGLKMIRSNTAMAGRVVVCLKAVK